MTTCRLPGDWWWPRPGQRRPLLRPGPPLPGLGRLVLDAISQRDYALVEGCVLFIAFNFLVVNLLVAAAFKVLAEPKRLHPFEKSQMIRKNVFKRTMLLAGFAQANRKFLAVIRLAPLIAFDDHKRKLFNPFISTKAPLTLFAFPSSMD